MVDTGWGPATGGGSPVRYLRLKEQTFWTWVGIAGVVGIVVGICAGLLLN